MSDLRAALEALADSLTREGNRLTKRRSYPQGVALRYAANQIRVTLAERLLAAHPAAETGEAYSVAQIQEAFAKHASPDNWGVPAFYEDGLISALRGEYDFGPAPSSSTADLIVDDGHARSQSGVPHAHTSYVGGCYRCDLSRAETASSSAAEREGE